jgi:CubicO group peptidase (beta-lactamase class C family)
MRYTLLLLFFPAFLQAQESFYFPPNGGSEWATMSFSEAGMCEDNLPALMDFLVAENSKAFIVTKGGKIVIEEYFGTFTADSLWLWNSAGKSLTSMAVGIAEQEGLLSLDDSSSDFLGEGWTTCDLADEALITVWNQITMTSGLDDGVNDVYCTDPECLTCLAEPGTRWAYHNGPYTMLDGVLSASSGTNLNLFIFNRISQPIGMTGLFLPFGYNRVFVSKARDMARFGSLALRGGEWNGTQILNAQYAYDMVHPSQSLNPSYGYLWWLNGQSSYMLPGFQFNIPGPTMPNAPADAYAALGKDSQVVLVVPSLDMVIIRMGDSPDGSAVSTQFADDMWVLVEDLFCVNVAEEVATPLEVFPNPAQDRIEIQGNKSNTPFAVYATSGQLVISGKGRVVELSTLSSGIYILESNGRRARFVVQ